MKKNFFTTLRDVPPTLADPTTNGFDPFVWQEAFQLLRDGSPQDDSVYLLGHALGQQWKRVQDSANYLAAQIDFRSLDELTPHFSRRINDIQRMAFDSWGKAMEEVDTITAEQTREMRCFIDAAGNAHSIQTPMEAVVDGIGGVFRLLGNAGDLSQLKPDQDKRMGFDDALLNLMGLAQHRLSIQRVWHSALWYRSSVEVHPPTLQYGIDESDSDLARRATVDLTRRQSFMARSFSRQPVPQEGGLDDMMVPRVMLESGSLKVRAVPGFMIPAEERAALMAKRSSGGILQDPALGDFIALTHPLVGLTIAEMMLIWGELALMAHQLHTLAQPLDVEKDGKHLSVILEGSLKRDEVIKALRQCVVLSQDRVAECVDFLCFKPVRNTSLWDRPLLAAGDRVCLLWWPLLGVHHARLLTAWSKTHASLAKSFRLKGTQNEKQMVESMRAAIARGPYSGQVQLIGASLHPRCKPDEEIDMLLVVGDTAFVIETASIPSPAEAYEFYETEKRLEQKADQCRTQCAVLRQDLTQIDDWRADGGEGPAVTKVFGLVITNSYLRDGNYADDICYCHWETLINIIGYGGMYFGLLRGKEEVTLQAPVEAREGEQIADVLIAALKKSPKAEFYARCLTQVVLHVKGYDHTDWEGIYRAWDIEIPVPDELEARLRLCSFGATLRETELPDFDD
ncbi:hypothetical protein Jab_2c10650 [Janthinobacterium sp. HH01]|uniref:hypothetical protein n=1 Tax=Janthinobacterium sp. HH01 TaxID=1198452 RepID=UPI0002AED252|nr:hypothetical protein [Janthinobacterium sp. HH01]ELX09006.1 hypothetical protein Jab_2c10650 [Janthinobacterium sp. HH01]